MRFPDLVVTALTFRIWARSSAVVILSRSPASRMRHSSAARMALFGGLSLDGEDGLFEPGDLFGLALGIEEEVGVELARGLAFAHRELPDRADVPHGPATEGEGPLRGAVGVGRDGRGQITRTSQHYAERSRGIML